MKKLLQFFSSPKLAVLLLLTFAVAMAAATFIENDFGTATAWILVYEAWWFELVMVGLGMSFTANIYKYRLWRKEKWAILLFHLAFIVILIGAGITRYASEGGIMRIREGAASNIIISNKNFLTAQISDGEQTKILQKELYFTPLRANNFSLETPLNETSVSINYEQFYADALPQIIEDEGVGQPMIEMVIAAGNGRESIFLEKGEKEEIGENQYIGFERPEKDIINIFEIDGQLNIRSPEPLDFFIMATQEAGMIPKDSLKTLRLRTLHRTQDISFVPMAYHPKGCIELVSTAEKLKDNDKTKDDALVVNVRVNNQIESVNLLYREGFLPTTHEVEVNGVKVALSYGAAPLELPFSVQLNDFQLERYPGSTSPSAYASEVTVLDQEIKQPYRIFMNNVLDYGGYRFYQASYDTDELGTVLSVNYDSLGTNVTYLGYFLMGLGMFFTLFGSGSHFVKVNKKLKKLQAQRTAATLILLLGLSTFSTIYGQAEVEKGRVAALIGQQQIDKHHAEQFGRLMVQDLDGRIKPINTLASEFIRKVSRKTYFEYKEEGKTVSLDANQAFLSMHVYPNSWERIPIIKIDKAKGGTFFKDLNIDENGRIAFNDLLDESGNYVLIELVEKANAKKPAEHNTLDKELIKVDERFNVLFNVLSGNYLKIFPNRNNTDNNTWYSYVHAFENFPAEDKGFVKNITPTYFKEVALRNWEQADEQLAYIRTYQNVLGKDLIPNEQRVAAELWYNKLNLNYWLFQAFFGIGSLLLILAIAKIFTQGKWLNLSWNLLIIAALVGFLIFAGNILLRWYVSQHAPWSNGYEMLVFVAWVLMLCGLLTFRQSDFALPLATLFSGTLLLVSYLDWLNPEITNLMPVLKSYWLKVHVATIVSSYAPLALSAVLGFMALLLMIFRTPKRAKAINIRIAELSYINEISMTIGLFVLAIGTFLGGVWANESWGRYWAWDPKETWALISIIIYATVLHLRFIPALRNRLALNIASVVAFGSIIMTSFGVNYYLSGLHSYAAGDPLPIPTFIYVLIAVVIGVSIAATYRDKQFRLANSSSQLD